MPDRPTPRPPVFEPDPQKQSVRFLLFTATILSAILAAASPPDRVQISNGILEGTGKQPSGVRSFKGIPFAQPPVGNLRWKPPQPPQNWNGVRQAIQFGPRCMQHPVYGDMNFRSKGMSEDCLYLNVWTPADSDTKTGDKKTSTAGLPVLVYFYGGGFVAGDSSEPRYDGESLAKRGIVFVSMNYRLGLFGFLAHPELTKESPHHASGDYALLDQNAALQWVQKNIAAFGGDPKRLTIGGESAGSISVSAQMASPLSKDLINGAIGESGSILGTLSAVPLTQAEQQGLQFANSVGATSLARLRPMTSEQLYKATSKDAVERFRIAVDGYFLPEDPFTIFAAGKQAHVPLLVGWNSEEASWKDLLGKAVPTPENYAKAVRKLLGNRADEVLQLYPASTNAEVIQSATELASDYHIAYSTWNWFNLQVETGDTPVYRYFYAHPRPLMTPEMKGATPGRAGGVLKGEAKAPATSPPGGAEHSAEIEYALGNLSTNKVFAWTPDDYKISDLMQQYFANFVKNADPNGPGLPEWPVVKKEIPIVLMRLDVDSHAEPAKHNDRYHSFAHLMQQADLAPIARKTLAILSGTLRMPGLQQPVHVLRDRWGVAHIYAENQHDLFFAQGVVAAQDRLFQMELWKLAGEGRLAEVLGPSALARDINARALRYRGDMKAEYESYAPDTQAILAAFTDGINSYIASLTAPGGPGLPVEFQLAEFTPTPWSPEDCLNRMAAFAMTGNAFSELDHAEALSELGPEKAARLFDFDPPVALDPAPGIDLSGLSSTLLENLIGSDRRIEFPTHAREGSNNWTISGALTATGKPLLANDPHRVIGLPSLRYMVHLVAPGWDVIGAGEPGLPGVALGHNQHIAWGFTIFGLDQQDLYVEELNPENPLEYKTESGWKTMDVRQEKFLVKGAAPTEVDLKFTRHGPILWEDRTNKDSHRRALALQWVGSEPGTAGYLASLAIDRAENWDQFEAAIPRWKVPSENIVYADDAGNIGEHSAGLAPIRKWTGLLPVPGTGNYNWTGFVPASDLPHFFNPKEGFVATANHKMIPDRYPYNVGFEWSPTYRVTRISSVIESAKQSDHKLTTHDMESLQTDITSLSAREFQELLRQTPLKNDRQLAGFLQWDARLTRDSPEAVLYEVWLRQLTRAVTRLISGKQSTPFADLEPNTILRILSTPDANIFGNNPIASRDQILVNTLQSARKELENLFGPDPIKYSWGKIHTINFRHALDQQPGAKALFDLGPLPRPGDAYTVNATDMEGDSWEERVGASYREILDTSNWDQSVAVNTPGQSGQPGSKHYNDLMQMWDAGEYFPMLYSKKAIEAETQNKLTLEP